MQFILIFLERSYRLANLVNVITLAVIGYIDYASYKIPNVVICGWLCTIVALKINRSTPISSETTMYIVHTLLVSLLVAGSFIPLSHVVECNAGDFKLFGMLVATKGLEDTLLIILISLSYSIFPFAGGVKKIPIGFLTFFGYIAFLIFRKEGIL